MSDVVKIELVTEDGKLHKFKTYEGLDLFLKEEYNVAIGIMESGVREDLSILDNLDENKSYNRGFSKGVSVGREMGYDAGFDAAMSLDSTTYADDDDYYY